MPCYYYEGYNGNYQKFRHFACVENPGWKPYPSNPAYSYPVDGDALVLPDWYVVQPAAIVKINSGSEYTSFYNEGGIFYKTGNCDLCDPDAQPIVYDYGHNEYGCYYFDGTNGSNQKFRFFSCATRPKWIFSSVVAGKTYARPADDTSLINTNTSYTYEVQPGIISKVDNNYDAAYTADGFLVIIGNCTACKCPPNSIDCGDCCLDCETIFNGVSGIRKILAGIN